jgi:TatD DNase family protein
MIIDTHCHLDDEQYLDDLQDTLDRAKESGVSKFIIPGADIRDLKKAKNLSQTYSAMYFGAGVHPYNISLFDIDKIRSFASHPKCIAIGECGLDYFRLPEHDIESEKEKQKEVFRAQLELAAELGKPVIIHIRDASRDSKEIIIEYADRLKGGVLHCFNADEELLSLAEHNFYFGIGGVVTFKNAKKLVNVLPKIPLDKLVVETDSPYLTPTPHRGTRNEPAYTQLIVKKIAEILGRDPNEIADITTTNAKQLFSEMKI